MIDWLLAPGLVLAVVQAYVLAYLAYLWLPALAAAGCAGRAPLHRSTRRERRFAILVSAHNEERVVGALLDSIARQHYAPDCQHVFVVANNCTDGTLDVVRRSGAATGYDRRSGDLATKGAALTWLWDRVKNAASECEVVLILDADNVVPADFLTEMNDLFEAGFAVVQSARVAKNAADSWTSQLDAVSETLWNKLDQAGRMQLGLSASIAGSGMAFERLTFERLAQDGEPGLLEDIEWQARLMLDGVRVGFAERARVYDEKTTRPEQLGRQRKRWVAGIVVAARRYGLPLLLAGIRQRDPRRLVAAFATTKPPRSMLLLMLGGLALLASVAPAHLLLLPAWLWTAALGSLIVYVLLGMRLDHAPPSAYRALLCAPAFAVIMAGASLAGAFSASRQRWIPTPHDRDITVDQLSDRAI